MIDFFLHFRPKKIPKEAIKFSSTFGLGGITFFLFFITFISGIFLMFYYTPNIQKAYFDIEKITFIIPYGDIIRDIHRLSGELMIIFSFLHMIRVVLKEAYEDQIRKLNWIFGIFLFILIFPLNFTGYILPMDTIGYWGASIVLNSLNDIPLIGNQLRIFLSGSTTINNLTLLRFYTYHIIVLPFIFTFLFFIHIYYVRKAKGVKIDINLKKNYVDIKELFKIEFFTSLIILAILLLVVFKFYNSPFGNYALTNSIPNKVNAPWYFLNFQFLLKYINPVIVMFILPLLYIIYLIKFPYKPSKKFFFILHFFIIFLIFFYKWSQM